jgi:hypothetical protein
MARIRRWARLPALEPPGLLLVLVSPLSHVSRQGRRRPSCFGIVIDGL